ncbi:MAG: sporulation protein YunB [Firmicutes bacterium]|nr:sporulation protein YunB [Bacillota bacterium]
MKKLALILIGLGLVIVGTVIMFKDAYINNIEYTAELIAKSAVSSKITKSLNSGFYNQALDEPLIYVERDEEGAIQYLEPNSRLINKLLLGFSAEIKENYSHADITEVEVNLGVLTGDRILSQLPFTAKVKIHPISLTKFQYESDFETEGINQTRYYLYCNVVSDIRIIAPFTDKKSTIEKKILLAEAIIVGKVPDNYVMVPEDSILDAIE